jgi:hypothetical protein
VSSRWPGVMPGAYASGSSCPLGRFDLRPTVLMFCFICRSTVSTVLLDVKIGAFDVRSVADKAL